MAIHWSEIYVNFFTIEVVYDDGAVQTWDYDCSQYPTMNDLVLNLAEDFTNQREDWSSFMLNGKRGENTVALDLQRGDLHSHDFAHFVMANLEDALWQPVAIS